MCEVQFRSSFKEIKKPQLMEAYQRTEISVNIFKQNADFFRQIIMWLSEELYCTTLSISNARKWRQAIDNN